MTKRRDNFGATERGAQFDVERVLAGQGTNVGRLVWGIVIATAVTMCVSLGAKVRGAEGAVVTLTLSPAPESQPALKYRFVGRPTTSASGNAAPVYLRLMHELGGANFDKAVVAASDMLSLTDEDFREKEAIKLLEPWQPRLALLRLGSLRKRCEWDYTLMEQREDVIAILLPDAQAMRNWGRLLALNARLQITQGKFEEAADTIATGFRFAQHVSQGPFLINGLVGVANARLMFEQLERWVTTEGTPNIYWAVTSMPRPLIDLRDSLETEYRIVELLFPEIDDFERLSAEGEWDYLYRRIVKRINALTANQSLFGLEGKKIRPLTNPKKEIGPLARVYLSEMAQWSEDEVKAMSDEQAIVLYVVHGFRDVRDTAFKNTYLPYDQGYRRFGETEARVQAMSEEHRGIECLCQLLASIGQAQLAEARLERHLAAIRTIEAVRMHLAETKGLPESLADVKSVEVPVDPLTGRPFLYRRQGEGAVLSTWDLADAFSDVETPFIDAKNTKRFTIEYEIEVRE